MGDGGSLGLFHKSQRQALSDTPYQRKALGEISIMDSRIFCVKEKTMLFSQF